MPDLPATRPDPGLLREAFLFSEIRTATKTATVSLYGNQYEVDSALAGRRVELVFDPFDLEKISVRYMDTGFGQAIPQRIGRHSHPLAEKRAEEPAPPTGIDYLKLVEARHRQQVGESIGYRNLITPTEEHTSEENNS